jgi:hypothetical protein
MRMVELLKKIIHKSPWKLLSVQTVNAKYGIKGKCRKYSASDAKEYSDIRMKSSKVGYKNIEN